MNQPSKTYWLAEAAARYPRRPGPSSVAWHETLEARARWLRTNYDLGHWIGALEAAEATEEFLAVSRQAARIL